MDFLIFFKYLITFLGAYNFFRDNNKINILKIEAKFILIITVITTLFMIVNLFIGIDYMTYEYRYGIRAFQFIYGHPGALTAITIFFCVFLILQIFEGKAKKTYFLGLLLNMLILISTLRSRAIVISAIIFILLYMFYFRKNKKINYRMLIGISIAVAFFIAYEQFDNYFISSDRTPRLDLLRGGIQVMLNCFPIGAGFATYGSFAASTYYSVLYYKFRFYNNYGMTPRDGQFLTDNFWPMIMGEFGAIGLVLYIILVYKIIKIIWKKSDTNYKKCISILIIFTILFNSLVSSSFVHYTAVAYMFILALILKMNSEPEKIS